jgi:hypothetical protein
MAKIFLKKEIFSLFLKEKSPNFPWNCFGAFPAHFYFGFEIVRY